MHVEVEHNLRHLHAERHVLAGPLLLQLDGVRLVVNPKPNSTRSMLVGIGIG